METFLPITLVNHTSATGHHPIYDIFVPQKVPLSKISHDVAAYDLWYPPIKNPGYAYVLVVVFLSKFFLKLILIDKNVGGL